MTTHNQTKLKTVFKLLQSNSVITSSLLNNNGISRHLRKYYIESGWLEPLGRGAYKSPDDKVEWHGAVNAIQHQTNTKVHVGALSALTLHGYSHYFRLNKEVLQLFSPLKETLPKWFTDYDWNVDVFHKSTSFLPDGLGIKGADIKGVQINISTPERAILECLYLAPKNMDLVECYQVLEGLVNLKPKLVTELLLACNSLKIRRLFLYMAEKANHQWFHFLKADNVDLGKGDRMITKKGVYNAKYLISIPKELAVL